MSWRGSALAAVIVAMPLLLWWSPSAYGHVFGGATLVLFMLIPALTVTSLLRTYVDVRAVRLGASLPGGVLAYGALFAALNMLFGPVLYIPSPASLFFGVCTLVTAVLIEITSGTPRRPRRETA